MQAVILAGGFGTRLGEETSTRPKPMVEIGGRPILWHIMKGYAHHGVRDFVVCCGYKGHLIKRYFSEYAMANADVTFDLSSHDVTLHASRSEPWRVTLVDTGEATMTGGRLRRVRHYLDDGPFCMTYGDGVSDVDVAASVAFHRREGGLATLTAVQPPGRFGSFTLAADASVVERFHEKPRGDGAWINGGFFVLEHGVFDYIDGDETVWERSPMARLAADGRLRAYRHEGFWQPMDTLRDRNVLEDLWQSGDPSWRVWS